MHSKAIILSSLSAFVLADTPPPAPERAQPEVIVDWQRTAPFDPAEMTVPHCALECIPQIGKVVGCDTNNILCFCSARDQIAHMVAPCLMKHCTGADMATTQDVVEKMCTRFGYPNKGSKRDVEACPYGNCPVSSSAPSASASCPYGGCPSPVETIVVIPSQTQAAPVCPGGGASPCPTYPPKPVTPVTPPSNGTAPPAVNKPPVVAGSSVVQAGLGLMSGALLVAVNFL